MIRKALLGLIASTMVTFACWWNRYDFDGNYIAGINNFQAHTEMGSTLETTVYRNGMSVSLPLTVWVKVDDRIKRDSETNSGQVEACLQYRVKRSGNWLTAWTNVRVITNPSYAMQTDGPAPLFGNATVDPKGLSAGDEIYLRYYITDMVGETGDLEEDLDDIVVQDTETYSTYTYSDTTWAPPVICRVVYSGVTRLGHK